MVKTLARCWAWSLCGAAMLASPSAVASEKKDDQATDQKPHEPHWFEKIKMRGYTQIRYSRLFYDNDEFVNVQGDKSIGSPNSFFIRRARLIVYGDVHERVFIYLQPDFANSLADINHVVILRDWYADIFLDKDKELRFRVGQSKVPYGFENMQSSQNRLPFDRSDALNSSVSNERDLGVFFYWAPKEVRKTFKHLVDSGLKGSGDYGMLGLGVYNGQTANQPEANNNRHVVARVSYPFKIGKQILEIGGGGYAGKFVVKKDDKIKASEAEFRDIRVHGSIHLYPQPIGFQAEYNVGVGPELNVETQTIREGKLYGGYAMVMVKLGPVIPYVRGVLYEGGKKHEKNAISYSIREVETGIEWQAMKGIELTAAFLTGSRSSPHAPYAQVNGHLARVQLQFNY